MKKRFRISLRKYNECVKISLKHFSKYFFLPHNSITIFVINLFFNYHKLINLLLFNDFTANHC